MWPPESSRLRGSAHTVDGNCESVSPPVHHPLVKYPKRSTRSSPIPNSPSPNKEIEIPSGGAPALHGRGGNLRRRRQIWRRNPIVEEKKRSITVAPFECAWDEEFRFREAGRGCITFEASAHNDVTLVFRQQPGSQHYHYKMDNSRHYTVILGSHRNKRLKIEVDGKTVVDVAGIGLCCSSSFQSYWISIYDGLISIGQGRHPNNNILFQWLDPDPNQNVQYVGLSSWDKHVGYRNISLMPSAPQNSILWSQIECAYVERDGARGRTRKEESKDGSDQRILANFLENWDLSDAMFVVGSEKKVVPAHKVVLSSCGDFPFNLMNGAVIELPSVSYPVLHSLLEFIYTSSTQISKWQLISLLQLSSQFKVKPLVMCCEEIIGCLKMNDTGPTSSENLQLSSGGSEAHQFDYYPFKTPLNTQKIEQFLVSGEHSDVNIYVNGHGLVAHAHKLILSLGSVIFDKMFTNGMKESSASSVFFEDVPVEAFFLLIQFMYSGQLKADSKEITPVLVELLLLSDQFGITVLQFECCKRIMEFLSEHVDMTVTSEEKVLDAILTWCMEACDCLNWTFVHELLSTARPEMLFGGRLTAINTLLPLVRFPLMQLSLLQLMEKSNLAKIEVFRQLVAEAIEFSNAGLCMATNTSIDAPVIKSFNIFRMVITMVLSTMPNITVTASSPNSRYTDPKALVSKNYQGTCFAGPRLEGGKMCSWWMVDIGQDHQLMCNYYTLRQDGSTTFMRSWVLQGSMDGRSWTSLRVHEDDQTICQPGQFASWPITGPSALLPFQYFRVMLTGPATGVSNTWNLCICFLELYGYFR
uniref:BTB domain-containing protein n=1 Tax=Leersia perrieri TaxID=77586 RepID=A0A0D9WFC6_9ORYZ